MYNWWFLLWVHSFAHEKFKKQEDDSKFFSIQSVIQVLEYSQALLVYSFEMIRRGHGQIPLLCKVDAADRLFMLLFRLFTAHVADEACEEPTVTCQLSSPALLRCWSSPSAVLSHTEDESCQGSTTRDPYCEALGLHCEDHEHEGKLGSTYPFLKRY